MLNFFTTSYQKIKSALGKTRSLLGKKIKNLFSKPWEEGSFDELEKILYEADLGAGCAGEFTEHMRKFLKKNPSASSEQIIESLQQNALTILEAPSRAVPTTPAGSDPLVILVVGVNGSGKTTTIAKLAKLLQSQNKKVLLAAGDTFRAAAIEQLTTWAERCGVEIVKSLPKSDPSAVAFDAITAAKARGIDVVLIDTAGRLQNKTDLMQELDKIKRVCSKVVPNSPHEVFLVLDANTGQNSIDQAQTFHQFTPLTGIILTKLDGSAKGGIVLAIYKQMGIPVRYVGIGEKAEDLMVFDPKTYVQALFESDEK
ncbi:MAG: signal recognition particle-docking protein FtsY [Chlamydiae bacterium]|nr:signal recognition particle-docking protein FtsY [Chlamydiota bacterium]